jgi:hypothetical protein
MITKYFKCKLLTDVVLNASLATEGNMQSLDFIPGSNFLGIVAKKYKDFDDEALDIFHSEKVKFGDALISKDGKLSYALPFSLFQEKGKQNICDNPVWVHHGIENFKEIKDRDGKTRQLKQNRSGYLNREGKYIKNVEKSFSLKSAYNAKERRSDDGKMFGFDSIKAGQEFIFPVSFEDESLFEQVKNALEGTKQLGKSKTAQYGQVCIKELETEPEMFSSKPNENNQLVVYAESRLCFLNKLGNPTFQPEISDFENKEIKINGKIAWDKCQIRTGSYSPWNAKRNTPDSQRSFIERGSVFVIETKGNIDVDNLPKFVGEYQNEGFGRVIYNPEFLKYKTDENGIWDYGLSEYPKDDKGTDEIPVSSSLGKFLKVKSEDEKKELEIGQKIIEVFNSKDGEILLDDKITKSQWGGIRNFATQAKSNEDLWNKLFDEKDGYLMHGVADEKIWGKYKGKRRKALSQIIEENRNLGTQFVAKLAAEIAKKQDNNG